MGRLSLWCNRSPLNHKPTFLHRPRVGSKLFAAEDGEVFNDASVLAAVAALFSQQFLGTRQGGFGGPVEMMITLNTERFYG